jgi:riboflavin transporter FmnP
MLTLLLLAGASSGGVIGLGLLFWLVMLFMLIFGFLWNRGQPTYYRYVGYHVAMWVCVALLGIRVFGWPIGN